MCRSSSLHSLALFAQLFNRDGADKHCYIRTLNFTDVNIKSVRLKQISVPSSVLTIIVKRVMTKHVSVRRQNTSMCWIRVRRQRHEDVGTCGCDPLSHLKLIHYLPPCLLLFRRTIDVLFRRQGISCLWAFNRQIYPTKGLRGALGGYIKAQVACSYYMFWSIEFHQGMGHVST